MIVLDTNVVSELMRPRPDDAVVAWVTDIAGDDLVTTSVTVAEILFGITRLPDGRRKDGLRTAWTGVLEAMEDRVLDVDIRAAEAYADIAAAREAAGRPIHVADGQVQCRPRADRIRTTHSRTGAVHTRPRTR